MANNNGIFISPGVYSSEQDFTSYATSTFSDTKLGMVTEAMKGAAFNPTLVTSFGEYEACFGGCSPCQYPNTRQPIYEGSIIARQFLSESNQLYVTRVLGLTGSNLGTAFGIQLGGAIDTTTSELTGMTDFSLTKIYNDGNCVSVTFSDSILQTLYDCGEITCDEIGTISNVSGDTVNLGAHYYGNCDSFTGADLLMQLASSEEKMLCITGSTMTGTTATSTTVTTNVTTIFSAGTITYNSTLLIALGTGGCTVSLINTDTSTVRFVESGTLQFNGGTITHELDGTITITNGTIILPTGEVLTGGTYKLCEFACASLSYLGCPDSGVGYSCVTGETSAITEVFITGETNLVTQVESGIVTQVWSGVSNQYHAEPQAACHNRIVAVIRSKGTYDGDQILQYNVPTGNIGIQPVSKIITPHGDFTLAGVDRLGNSFSYNISLDRSKRNFIKRVFTDELEGLCCINDAPIYIEEFYENMLDQYIEAGCIHCIKPTLICCGNMWDYTQQYTGAKTPWIVSELQGTVAKPLFRFHTIGDGNAANSDIKISLTNIKPDEGTFDVLVRKYNDNDSRPVILERYSRLTLDPQSNNYIARQIGDNDCFDGNGGCNIFVEMASDCLSDAFPAGFEGYPVKDYCDSQPPELQYKKCYADSDKVRKVYLGISDTLGIDKDFFAYKGVMTDGQEWTGRTKGFHMDINADTTIFEVGCAAFQNNADLDDTAYDKLNSRKFTVNFYGGWDGWDVHRTERTNKDTHIVRGTVGRNGLLSGAFSSYINDDNQTVINSDFYAWEKAIHAFRNPEETDINLFVTPGINSSEHTLLVEEAIEMIEEERCDSLYVFTTLDTESDWVTPLDPDSIVDQIDGLFDSSYSATYAGWGKISCNDSVTGNFRLWVPPTAAVVKAFAYTDKIAAPWFAAGGINRGKTDFERLRVNWTQEDRDTLYEGRVNPLAKFTNVGTGDGIYIWGNKTTQIDDTSLDRINVRRLLLRLRKIIAASSTQLLFDQNDEILRTQFLNIINPILEQVRTQRGLLNFRVEVDSIDTSGDSNSLCGRIIIQPTRALEVLCLDYQLSNSGAFFTT